MITITKEKVNNSELRYIVKNNNYITKMTYDYDFYEIKENNFLIGYILKYNILGCNNLDYIDIHILSNYRNKGIGSVALHNFISKEINKPYVGVITNDERKINFLLKNNFIYDEIYIYKNLYKFRKVDKNE